MSSHHTASSGSRFTLTRSRLLRATLLGAAVAAVMGSASALSPRADGGRVADVSIVERATGRVLPIYRHNGELWVAGRPGANYAVRVRSQEDRRIMAVISVDGVNAINGKTASSKAENGYVLDARDSYDVTGWRKSNDNVAAFYFSQSDMSYAARTGRPNDVGVIGVALFREKLPEPVYNGPVYEPSPNESEAVAADAAVERAAPNAGSKNSTVKRAPAAAPSLGTGHGAVESSQVTQVDFEADTDRPRRIVRIRYDSYANLVAKGVIREPKPRPVQPSSPRAFPGDDGFVPDPPRN